jgi:hypothetical protein
MQLYPDRRPKEKSRAQNNLGERHKRQKKEEKKWRPPSRNVLPSRQQMSKHQFYFAACVQSYSCFMEVLGSDVKIKSKGNTECDAQQ